MKISHADHYYKKLKKDPLENFLGVYSINFALNVAIFTFTMISNFTFLHSKTEKKHKNLAFHNATFMVFIFSLKPKGKGDCKKFNPFKFSFMSLYIF